MKTDCGLNVESDRGRSERVPEKPGACRIGFPMKVHGLLGLIKDGVLVIASSSD